MSCANFPICFYMPGLPSKQSMSRHPVQPTAQGGPWARPRTPRPPANLARHSLQRPNVATRTHVDGVPSPGSGRPWGLCRGRTSTTCKPGRRHRMRFRLPRTPDAVPCPTGHMSRNGTSGATPLHPTPAERIGDSNTSSKG